MFGVVAKGCAELLGPRAVWGAQQQQVQMDEGWQRRRGRRRRGWRRRRRRRWRRWRRRRRGLAKKAHRLRPDQLRFPTRVLPYDPRSRAARVSPCLHPQLALRRRQLDAHFRKARLTLAVPRDMEDASLAVAGSSCHSRAAAGRSSAVGASRMRGDLDCATHVVNLAALPTPWKLLRIAC